ncbi:MAG: chorismate synthase [Ruminococcaceae bacterium]|nr:chorismate synthase [Oscillospiraceae bacterium]
MSFVTGNKIRISLFGQSHSEAMGTVIDGLPSGFKIDEEKLAAFMARRAPGNDEFSTTRKEGDKVRFVSGITNGVTNGAPLCGIIENTNTRSKDYENLKDVPRPGHADFAAWSKFGDNRDVSGGGQFSGRLTATMCIAGGICKQLLEEKGIHIGAHIASIGTKKDDLFDAVNVNKEDFVGEKSFPVINDEKGEAMKEEIRKAKSEADSIGGTIECAIVGVPAGIGDTLFGGWESKISSAIFAIPAVKGIEFGRGFEASTLRGSENNDAFRMKDGEVVTSTNNHGGILGGISSGMPIIFRAAFKPTPSIGKEQESVSLSRKENTTLIINGRHDPCIVKRAVVCVEAAAAIVAANMIL